MRCCQNILKSTAKFITLESVMCASIPNPMAELPPTDWSTSKYMECSPNYCAITACVWRAAVHACLSSKSGVIPTRAKARVMASPATSIQLSELNTVVFNALIRKQFAKAFLDGPSTTPIALVHRRECRMNTAFMKSVPLSQFLSRASQKNDISIPTE